MKKKLIALFLVVATLLSCVFAFAACDKDKDKGGNGNANETYTEEDIVSLMGKIATYVITSLNHYQQINLETNVSETADDDAPFLQNSEWFLVSCIYVLKYNTVENATAAIEYLKNEMNQYENLDGELVIEQHGKILVGGGKNTIEAVRAIEDKTVEILTQEFINQYKLLVKENMNSTAMGVVSFSYEERKKAFYVCGSNEETRTEKTIWKLVNDASAEEIEEFNKSITTGGEYDKVTKINDKLYFLEEKW